MANARIDLEVGYKIDRRSYQQLIDSLKDVQVNAQKALDIKEFGTKSETEIKKVSAAAQELQGIMEQSWDHKLNQVNLTKLNTNLATAGKTATQFYNTLASGGKIGQTGADAFARSMMEANVELVKTNKLIDKMAVTFGNTIRYGISSSIFNTFSNSIRNAYEYTKQLDTSLNDIRIVSGKSANEMAELAVQANKAAQALGRTTLDYTKAATIFYQQGLDSNEVAKRTEVVLKAANVTGQSAAEVSEQLTAVWNGYQVQAEQLELYVDKLAAVAASSASDLEELSTGMSKVASAANVMGVDIDQLTAQMSTIISVTRQAPESVGTALRTIYARIADIKAGIDGDTTLGNYSGKMAKLGFNVLDASGNLKDMGAVIEEIGGKWETLTREQQISLAQTMAGTRQYNNLLTLFDNWDKYTQALNTSKTAAGKLQQQQDIYMESTEAHLKQMTAEAEELYSTLFNQEAARTFIDIITGGLKSLNGYIKTLGGGFNTFLGLGSQVINLFSGKIADSVGGFLEKRAVKQENKAIIKGQKDISDAVLNEHKMRGENLETDVIAKEAQLTKDILKVKDKLTQEEFQQLNYQKSRISLLEEEKKQLKQSQAENEKSAKEQVASAFTKTVSEKYKLYGNDIENPERIAQALEEAKSDLAYNTDKNDKETYATQGKIVEYLEKRLKLLQDINNETDRLNDIEAEEDALTDNIKKKTDNAGKRLNLQNTLKYTTAILQGFSIVTGAIQTINDDAATAEEKATAAFNGFVGAGSAIANAFLPGSGMLVQMAGSLLENLGLTKALANLFKTDIEREQERINTLRKEAEGLNQKFEETSTLINSIKDDFSSYNDLITILNGCDTSTKAWADALQNVEQKILDILKKYPALAELENVLITDESGNMRLNEDVAQTYLNLLQNRQLVTQYASLKTTNDANIAQDALELEKLRNQVNKRVENITYQERKNIAEREKRRNASVGESTSLSGSDLNRINTQMKEEGLTEVLSKSDINDLLEKSQNVAEYNQAVNQLVKNLKDTGKISDKAVEEFTTSLESYRQSLEDISDNMTKTANTAYNTRKLMASAMFGGNATGIESTYFQKYYDAANKSVDSVEKLVEKYTEGQNIAGGINLTRDDAGYAEFIAKMNKLSGSEKYGLAKTKDNRVYGNDGSEGIWVRNQLSGQDEFYDSVTELMKEVREEMVLRKASNDMNTIRGQSNEFISSAQQKVTGLDKEDLNLIFNDNFDINQLSQDKAKIFAENRDVLLKQLDDTFNNGFSNWGFPGIDKGTKEFVDKMKEKINKYTLEDWDEEAYIKNLEEKFKNALSAAAENASQNYDLDKEDFEGFGEYLKEIADDPNVEGIADELKEDGKAVGIVTKSVMRMNQGIEILAKNMKNWKDILDKSTKSSYEYWEALDGVKDAISKLLDVEKSAISTNFVEKHLDKIQAASEGDEKAIDALRDAYADFTIEDFTSKIDFSDAARGVTKSKEDILGTVKSLVDEIQAMDDNIDIGTLSFNAPDDSKVIEKFQEIIDTAGYTVEEANKAFAAMGYEAEFEADPQNTEVRVPVYTTYTKIMNPISDWSMFGKGWIPKETSMTVQTGEEVMSGSTMATSLGIKTNDGKNVYKPRIKSLTKKAHGSMNNYSSKNKGGGSPGGKGGGGSSAKPSKKDPNKDELDRYQLVNVQLKEISKQLGKLDKEKNKLLGGKLLANLNAQIKLLNDQITVTEAKLKIAQQEQAEVANTLSGYGVKFDKEGNIANYAAVFKQEQAKLNAVYTNYNNMSKDAQEAYEDTVKTAEETWNKFKESVTKYDNLIGDTIPQLQQDIRDAFDRQTEIYIQEFNAEIKVRLDMSSAERDWNEFKRKVIDGVKDDDILGMATAKLKDFYSYYNEAGTAEIQALTKQLQGQLEELRKQDDDGSADWYRDNRVKAIEDLKDNYDKIRKSLEDIVALEEEMQQKLLDMMNQAQEKFDDQVGTFENINKQLEHNVELINLLTDQNDYEALAQQYAAQTKNRKEELDFYTKQKEFWEMYLTTLEQGSKEWEVAKEKYNAAAEAWASALETTIQAARQEFENNINLIFKTINNQLTNNKGLDYLNEEWELLADNSDLVLDNINKMQKMQDLTKKYNDAINSTSNIKAQQTLAQLRDSELDSLKAMGQLSEKDLERAEKKLDIVKAQIALEDAQRNKSQMRLRRDSQGNYRYQFVADEDQINQAQQNLYSAYNELYNFDKSRYIETLKQAADAWKEYQEKMAEAALINDPEMRAQKEALIKEQYDEQIGILHEQLQRTMQELNESTFAELNALYAENEDNYELMTLEQQAALNDFNAANQTAFDLVFDLYTENTEKFHDMAQDQIDVIQNQMVPQWTSGYQDLVDAITGEGGIEEVSNRLMDEMQTAVDDYNTSLEETEAVAGNTFETISNAENEVIQLTQDMLDENDVLIDKYEELTNAVGDQYQMLKDLMSEYEDAANKAKEAAEDAYEYIMKAKEAEAKDYAENVDTGPTTGGTGRYEGTQNLDTTTVTPIAKTEPNPPFSATLPRGTALYNANGYQYPKSAKADRAVTVEAEVNGRYRVWGSTFSPHTVYVDKNAVRYDTGGYTGAWGTEGRMAMLHEKELVLNKKDTANMLNAVDILRGITDNIGADVLDKMASMKANGLNMAMGANAIDQNVHIEATFPGVTSSIEIQDALNNLVNMAAQRATRTR